MHRRRMQMVGTSIVLLILTDTGVQGQSVVGPRGTTRTESRAREKAGPEYAPEVTIQSEDYASARARFRTRLLRKGPAPQDWIPLTPPAGVREVEYSSGSLRLKAWVNRPADTDLRAYPAVLFLHGGFAFDLMDWQASQPYRDAGFIVLAPMLRGENGQPGNYSMFYDEVEDVVNAAEYLRKQPYVDASRLYVAGPSVGGTLAMLAAMTSPHFRAAVSFSGSPDQVLYIKHAPGANKRVPFDVSDMSELKMRSPLAYATSFKCPARLYYGTEEPHFRLTTHEMARLANKQKLDVQAIETEGDHGTHVPASMKLSIEFFQQIGKGSR